ncbi:serine hydrolase domain-containing protein [Spongiimicrobium sp. 3-5]|uniref:serine hydrolase domain-containing protein n=1 Tax=Spongiimicrobium sp. 3-5 TaxID=3332596 RepID=UPI00397FC7A1
MKIKPLEGLGGLEKANAKLHNLIATNQIPGLAITVKKEGSTIFQKGFGYADLEHKKRVDPKSTIFRIASVSKPIAATALAHMVKDGLIDLDASFYNYVPYYPRKKYDFSIRQLAGHTAGIRTYRGKEYALNKPFSIKEGISVFKDDDLHFEPGTDYLYNSYGWSLISLAMQEASGVPFETYVKDNVLQPLKLNHTFPEIEGQHVKSKAKFYTKNQLGFKEAVTVNNFYKLAGGGFLSTSDDIANFGQAILEDQFNNPLVLNQFLQSQNIKGIPTYYGLGWQVSSLPSLGAKYYGHIGNSVGAYSNFFIFPKERLVCAILTNCSDAKIQQELDKVLACIISEHTTKKDGN